MTPPLEQIVIELQILNARVENMERLLYIISYTGIVNLQNALFTTQTRPGREHGHEIPIPFPPGIATPDTPELTQDMIDEIVDHLTV